MIHFTQWTALLEAGGITLLLLFFCALVCLVIIVERFLYFQAHSLTVVEHVLGECRRATEPYFEEVKSRAIAEKLPEMERFLLIQATLAAVSPYIGLLGTVLGVIRAFHGLGTGGEAAAVGEMGAMNEMNELNAGIAQALVATAAGLFVAIPSTVSYNHLRKKVNELVRRSEVAASRLKVELFGDRKRDRSP